MKYTNKHNFPDYVVQWLKFDEYDYEPNTFSATTLLQPPKVYALKKQYYDQIETDVSDVIASRYGTAIHDSIEKIKLTNCLQEQRLRTKIADKVITGKFDIMKEVEKGVYRLIDVKSTSVWTFVFGSKEEDYIKQLSIYRFLGHMNGYNVQEEAEIFMIFTDWSAKKSRTDPEYPQTRIKIVKIRLWGIEKTREFITERVNLLSKTSEMKQEDMPECNEKDLWAMKPTYNLMRDNRTIATYKRKPTRILSDSSLKLVEVKGKVKRCKYCPASKFCDQCKRLIKEMRYDDE